MTVYKSIAIRVEPVESEKMSTDSLKDMAEKIEKAIRKVDRRIGKDGYVRAQVEEWN